MFHNNAYLFHVGTFLFYLAFVFKIAIWSWPALTTCGWQCPTWHTLLMQSSNFSPLSVYIYCPRIIKEKKTLEDQTTLENKIKWALINIYQTLAYLLPGQFSMDLVWKIVYKKAQHVFFSNQWFPVLKFVRFWHFLHVDLFLLQTCWILYH